jgi:hypothetical protein
MNDEDHAKWCREMHTLIAHGGLWGLPRTGLVFRKTGNVLIWVGVIPPKLRLHDIDAAREQEFEQNLRNFSDAGVPMWRANTLKHFDSMEDAQKYYRIEGEMLTEDLAIAKARALVGDNTRKKREKVR